MTDLHPAGLLLPDDTQPTHPAWVGLSRAILTRTLGITDAVSRACALLTGTAGAEIGAITLTGTFELPQDMTGWLSLGRRAVLYQHQVPGTTCRLGPEGEPATAEAALQLSWLSLQSRTHTAFGCADILTLPADAAADRDELNSCRVRAFLGASILSDGTWYGGLGAVRSTPGPWPSSVINGVALFADALATRMRADDHHHTATAALRDVEEIRTSRNRLVSTMGHELRTPLAVVVGSLEFVHEDLTTLLDTHPTLTDTGTGASKTGAEAAEAIGADATAQIARIRDDVGTALTAAGHLTDVVNDTLNLARAHEADCSSCTTSLPAAVADVLHWNQATITDRNIQVSLDVPAGAAVAVSASALRQILLNLVTNAVNYNRPGGSVTITAAAIAAEQLGTSIDCWRITVTDTGPGLSDDQLEHVFDPFVRYYPHGEQTAAGTGLGLAVTRTLAERYNGQVGARQESTGVSFFVELPASDTPVE